MSAPIAPSLDIYTPFNIPTELLTGFDYTVEPIEYIRYGIGIKKGTDYGYDKALMRYNEYLKNTCPTIDVKVILISNINIDDAIREFIGFQITVNHYTLKCTNDLTAKQLYNLHISLPTLLQQSNIYPVHPFFVTSMETHLNTLTLAGNSISIPDIGINIDVNGITTDKLIEIFDYIDRRERFYRAGFEHRSNTPVAE